MPTRPAQPLATLRLALLAGLPPGLLAGYLYAVEQSASTVWMPEVAGLALLSVVLSVALVLAPLAVLPVRTRVYAGAASAVLAPLFAVNLVHVVEYRELISLGAIDAIASTTWAEAREFAVSRQSTVVAAFALALVLGGAFAWLVRSIPSTARPPWVLRGGTAAAGLAALAVLGAMKDPPRVFPLSTVKNTYDLVQQRKAYASLRQARAGFTFGATAPDSASAQTVVLIIGESLRRRQLAQYGYGRNTMPLTSRRPALVYEDVVSTTSQTQYSVKAMLTSASAETVVQHADRSVLTLAREAGYQTWWLSNQDRTFDTEVALIAGEADRTVYTNHSWSAERQYDEALLGPLAEALADPAPRKLIVLHLVGSHEHYSRRYPPEQAYYSRAAPSTTDRAEATRQALIDQYDDSVRYTDAVLARMLARLDRQPEPWLAIFLSDHGEHLHDTAAGLVGHGMPEIGLPEVEVPLLIWGSPAHRAQYPETWDALRANRAVPTTSADLFFAMASILEVHYPAMDPTQSFASEHYAPRARMLLTVHGTVQGLPGSPGL